MSNEKPKKLSKKDLEIQCEEYLTGWKQALADYDNLKKGLDKEKELIRNLIREELVLQLIPVLDNFDQANRHMPELNLEDAEKKKLDNWVSGMRYVKQQLEGVIKELGLEQVNTSGMYDPELHEVVEERSGDPEGEILEVIQTGWKLNTKIIRPAKVIISKTEEGKNSS